MGIRVGSERAGIRVVRGGINNVFNGCENANDDHVISVNVNIFGCV